MEELYAEVCSAAGDPVRERRVKRQGKKKSSHGDLTRKKEGAPRGKRSYFKNAL